MANPVIPEEDEQVSEIENFQTVRADDVTWQYKVIEPWHYTNQERGIQVLCEQGWEPFAVVGKSVHLRRKILSRYV